MGYIRPIQRPYTGLPGYLGTTIGEKGISPKESEQDCLDVHARALRAGARAHYARAQYTTSRSGIRGHEDLSLTGGPG